MANDFFRNSIPSSVPKHYIAYGNKKNQMSNALFLVYFSTVNGVEALGEVSGGRLAPKDSGASCAPWDSRRGCCAGLCTNSGTLSVGSSSQKTLSSSMLPWTLNAARGRAFPSLVSRVLTDAAGPRGLLAAGVPWSGLVESSPGTAWLQGCMHSPAPSGSPRPLHPPKVNPASCSSHPLLMEGPLGLLGVGCVLLVSPGREGTWVGSAESVAG